ncbi:hypothetical protein LTR53_011369 [Teratosphaeriaceae sp. CCFEE 6253]|nr:hypothetical protein LTR53_011369 [Teratosphaeriaceae sp. CCFEE 6253]
MSIDLHGLSSRRYPQQAKPRAIWDKKQASRIRKPKNNMQPKTEDESIQLVALGNGVWLDEIRKGGAEPIKDVPGGSVTFSTLGARLFAADNPASIGMSFKAGHDFPESIVDVFSDWAVDLTVHRLSDKPSSRGLVFYDEANSNRKGFERLTEPLPVTVRDLRGTSLLSSQAFTFFGTAEYIETQIADLVMWRPGATRWPFAIWEPHAKSCRTDTLAAHQRAARLVDVFSPNHEELHSFFGGSGAPAPVDRAAIENHARIFLGYAARTRLVIVVRAAEHGCLVLLSREVGFWVPPFYPPDSGEVVDPTGAGNAFLGALAVGWLKHRDYRVAAEYGTVAASFALEQVGLPVRSGYRDRTS